MSPKRHSMNSWKSLALVCEKATFVKDGKANPATSIAIAIVVVIDAVFLVSEFFNAIANLGDLLRLVYMWVRMSIFYKSSLKENGRIIPVRHLERAKRE